MKDAAILNSGGGAWAFEELAHSLSRAFDVPVVSEPAKFNYVLGWEGTAPPAGESFVPWEGIKCANDKRLIARAFEGYCVPSPATFLLSDGALQVFLQRERERRWVLKYPTGSGGAGHRFIHAGDALPDDWPRPFVVQEFVAQPRPQVFRFYGIGGVLFGWNVRRFPSSVENPSAFVSHARGAQYESVGLAPPRAVRCARKALEATGLWSSWGCVDLVQGEDGRWLALEVGTDGVWGQVDRDIALSGASEEIEMRLARAFKAWCERG